MRSGRHWMHYVEAVVRRERPRAPEAAPVPGAAEVQNATAMHKAKVLFLAANPVEIPRLQLAEEARAIAKMIRQTKLRDSLELITRWAIQPDDVLHELLEYQPTIVHFSSHGSPSGQLIMEKGCGAIAIRDGDAFVRLLDVQQKRVRVVVLNACHSHASTQMLAGIVDCVVSLDKYSGGRCCQVFARSFYRSIGYGVSVGSAFDHASALLQLEGCPAAHSPMYQTIEFCETRSIEFCETRSRMRAIREIEVWKHVR